MDSDVRGEVTVTIVFHYEDDQPSAFRPLAGAPS